jgi:hypothetical protein
MKRPPSHRSPPGADHIGRGAPEKAQKKLQLIQPMKTSIQRFASILSAVLLTAASTSHAAVLWDHQLIAAAGSQGEFAREGIATNAAGVTYVVGYQNDPATAGTEAFITRRAPAGAPVVSASFQPVAADSYWYTGVAVNGALLVVTGTHYNAATGAYEWFARSLDAATLANVWTVTLTPASLGRTADTNSFSGRVAITATGVFVSGNTDNSLAAVNLMALTGAFNAVPWPVAGAFPAGVRTITGKAVSHPMPGNVGGIFRNIQQSFIEVQGGNVTLAGTLDFGLGTRADAVLASIVQLGGTFNWSLAYDNATQNEMLKATAVGSGGVYLTGETRNGTGASFLVSYDFAGGPGAAVIGPVGSYANDVEAYFTGGIEHIYQAGFDSVSGRVWHFEGLGLAVSGAWGSSAFGTILNDVATDLAVGTSGGFVNFVYATGSMFNTAVPGQGSPVQRISPTGVVVLNYGLFNAMAVNNGCGIIYNNVINTVFRCANGITSTGRFGVQHGRFAP